MKKILINSVLLFISWSMAAQCLTDWSYRVPVVIDNSSGSLVTDYQISFSLDMSNLIASGKMKSDGADIRLTDKSGTILAHWIEETTTNTSNATVWVKLNNQAAVQDTVYLFYGNASATTTSNGEATFSFFDDFQNGSIDAAKWISCGTGSATINAGRLQLTGDMYLYGVNQVESPFYVEANIASLPSSAISSIVVNVLGSPKNSVLPSCVLSVNVTLFPKKSMNTPPAADANVE